MSLGRQLARNAAAAFANQAVLLVLGLAGTAVFARALGTERFGAWGLIGAVVAYAGLLDLGIGLALLRRMAESHETGDDAAAGEALGAGLRAALILGLAGALAVALLAEPLAGWLRVAPAVRGEFTLAVRLAALAVGLMLPGVPLGAVPTAWQRLDAVYALETGVSVVCVGLQIAAVAMGFGLAGLAAPFALSRALSLGGRWLLARRYLGHVPWRARAGYPFWQRLGRFGTLKIVHQGTTQVVLYLDRFLVGALLSVQAVAWYTVAVELAQRLLLIPGNIAGAFYPAACAAARDREQLARLYARTSRAVTLLTVPPALVLAVFAAPILRYWVGADYAEQAATLLRLLAVAYALMATTAVPAGAADALDRPDLPAAYGLVSAVINVTLALVLIPRHGVAGAGWAVLGNTLLQQPFFIRAVTTRLMGQPLGAYLRTAVLEPLAPAAACAGALLGARALGADRSPFGLALAALAGLAAFLAAARAFGAFAGDERAFVAGLPGGRLLRYVVGG